MAIRHVVVLLLVAVATTTAAQPPGAEPRVIRAHGGNGVCTVAFAPNGKTFASCGLDEVVNVWSFADGKLLATLRPESKYAGNSTNDVAYSPDGKRFAVVTRDPVGWVFDLGTGKAAFSLKGHTYTVNAVRYSPDGKLIATAAFDGKVRLWDAATGKDVGVLDGDKTRVYGIAFSPDGKILASCGEEGPVHLWDVATRNCVNTLVGHTNTAHVLAFSPDGKWLVSGGREQRGVNGPGKARVWDAKSGKQVAEAQGLNGVLAVAVSPDSTRFAFAGESTYVKVVDIATGKDLATLKEHRGSVSGLAFSPDGKALLSGSSDGNVHVWDVSGIR